MGEHQRFLLFFCALFAFTALPASAQLSGSFPSMDSLLGGGSFSGIESKLIDEAMRDMENSLAGFSLDLKPKFPAPNEAVLVSLNDYSINSTGARVEWYVDDILVPSASNRRSVPITAPGLGGSITVKAKFLFPSGRVSEAVVTIKPVQVDVIIEPVTRVPAFYKGRSLASQQASIRAVALVYADKSGKAATGYSYKWKTSGGIIEGGSLYEGNVMQFTPPLRRSTTIELQVADPTGTVVGSKMVTLPIIQPSVAFYEVNPLRGQSLTAVGNPFRFGSQEVSVRAEPYNVSYDALNDPRRETGWRLNGSLVEGGEPFIITLREEGGSGRATVNWQFRSPLKQTQSIGGSFAAQF